MNVEASTSRNAFATSVASPHRLADASRTADAIKRRWRQGETPDLNEVLSRHPELGRHRSIVLDLAHTEFEHRRNGGEAIDAETFARRFPSLERSLLLLIEVQDLLAGDPDLRLLQEKLPWPDAGDDYLQFHLITEIGRGAFGRVFLATEPAIGDRQVVVKIAPSAGGEAEVLGKLRHPNIVPVYSLHEQGAAGLAAFCMPYLGRATLCDVIDDAFDAGRPPHRAQRIIDAIARANRNAAGVDADLPTKILRNGSYVDGVLCLASQLADALAHSHEHGIYHRDLKPSNVLMTSEGRPLLLDFNLSIDSRLPAWKVGGTLPYMAPEELVHLVDRCPESGASLYDPRSDIFSLGIIVYELLTGRLPFGKIRYDCGLEEAGRRLHRQQADGPRPVRSFNRQVDRRLSRLVEQCLAFDPKRRPETARELGSAFRGELKFARRACRWTRTHRTVTTIVAAASASSMVAASLFFFLRPPYSERELESGLACIARRDYPTAIERLNNSIVANPKSSEALFARGRAYHRQGIFQAAFRDYSLAHQLNPSGLVDACRGYCLSRIKSHKVAIVTYNLAISRDYDRPALVYNNIGYSYLALGQLDDAERSLLRATELDDGLLAPHYNLIVLSLCRANLGRKPSDAAFAHAAKAIQLAPSNAELCRVVAALHATRAREDRSQAELAASYVARAVEAGYSPKIIQSGSYFSAIQTETGFQQALTRTASTATPATVSPLVDPLDAGTPTP
ncbi:MAG: serine/threonine-protein kinase [Planctomycetaceae bacterium]|nr:serine/threonine-protein kinase [Planctomycetaceae bacterium]